MGVETLLTNAGARRTLRRLELEAYASVVSAFRAQGPFTWEKKESLELLCKHLGISRERHRAEIRRAVNDELLTSVAGCIFGTETENAWRKEGQKLTSMNPRFVARQVTHLPQVLASATVNAALGTNVVKPEPEIKKGTSLQVQNALKFIISQNPMTAPKPSPQSQLATKPKVTQVPDKDTATITVTTATGSSSTATVATSSSKLILSPSKSLIPSTPPSTPKAAATQTVSAGVQTLSSSASTQTPSSTTDAEKSLSVDQETQTPDKRGQEPKLSHLNTPDNPATESPSPSIQGATLDVSGSKPAGSEDHSSDKVPLMGREEVPESDQSSAGQETSVGRPDQQKPLQSSVEEEKHDRVAKGTEATPDTRHKPQVDSKHSESPSLDLPSATLPVQVPGAAMPVQDMDTSAVAPPPPPPPVVSSTSENAPKPTPLLVVATTIIPASKPVGVTATNTSALTSPLSVVGDSNVPITETQSRESRKRPLTPTSLPPPAKKPAPPPLVTPTLTLTPGTPHVPIPALTPISVHTDATGINPTSTNVKSSTDFSHKQRYPPPPLVHASTVTLPDITTRLKRRSASPSTGLERPHGEVQLRTLLQGAPVVTTSETPPLPLSVSLPSLPAVSQRSSSPTPPPPPPTMASPLPPRLTSPPPLTLPPTPSTTPTPAPSNTDAFIQALCSDPASLEDSTVSALATQLGLDFTDLGLLAGSDLLQLIQPIGTEPVSASASADVMMETQLPSTQLPSTQLPSTQLPSTQLPSTQLPSTQLPSTQLPSTQLPSTQLPSTQLPSTQLPPMNIPQPVTGTSDNSLPGLVSTGVGLTKTTAASPGTTPSGLPGMLMTPTPQDHVGMLGELCLQPSGGDNPVFPDLSSLSSSTIESELLEGIPQELAETIQALARLDEQNTAYSPIQ